MTAGDAEFSRVAELIALESGDVSLLVVITGVRMSILHAIRSDVTGIGAVAAPSTPFVSLLSRPATSKVRFIAIGEPIEEFVNVKQ